MFAQLDGVPTFGKQDLLRLSAVLVIPHMLLVTGFALTVWPLLGLPIGRN